MIYFDKKAKCPLAGKLKCDDCRFYITREVVPDIGEKTDETHCLQVWMLLEIEQLHKRIFCLQAELGELKQATLYSLIYELTDDGEAKRTLINLLEKGGFNVALPNASRGPQEDQGQAN